MCSLFQCCSSVSGLYSFKSLSGKTSGTRAKKGRKVRIKKPRIAKARKPKKIKEPKIKKLKAVRSQRI